MVKRTLAFDPNDYDYGPATHAIRTLLTTWAEIEWFVNSSETDDVVTARFVEHNALAHRYAPELFPSSVTISCVSGGWPEFIAWCKRVREQTRWDWKFSILKTLSRDHAMACGWSLQAQALHLPAGPLRPGDLFVRFGDDHGAPSVIWNNLFPTDTAFAGLAHTAGQESVGFYVGHAQVDAINAIQWQLAENHGDMTENPFVPLVSCYSAGAYPFSLGRDAVVLFRFAADERFLPRATLLPPRR